MIKTYILFFSFFLLTAYAFAQQHQSDLQQDTITHQIDSSAINKPHVNTIDDLLKKNKFINSSSAPTALIIKEKSISGKEFLFYLLGIVIFLLAVCKAFYSKYFNNIFKVFFNTSLRQNQLTDLLLQAKLPSLIFNCFFAINVGLYVWLLLNYYHAAITYNSYLVLATLILFIGITYFGKFITLKFVGWLSGMSTTINQYIFVMFLINKIIGIILIPFVVLLAFAPQSWINIIILLSFLVTGIFFLLRYLRSYSLLQNKLRVNFFHFIIYMIGMEILPVLLIYRLINVMLL